MVHDAGPSLMLLTSLSVVVIGCWISKDSKIQYLVATSTLSILLVVAGFFFTSDLLFIVSFGIEIGYCLFDLVVSDSRRRLGVEVLVHHTCSPVAIFLSLFRPNISLSLLGILNLSLSVSNVVTTVSRFLYQSGKRIPKAQGLLVSCMCGFICRIAIPLYCVCVILSDLKRDRDRPEWARLYASSIMMLMYLNVQCVYNIFVAYQRADKTNS